MSVSWFSKSFFVAKLLIGRHQNATFGHRRESFRISSSWKLFEFRGNWAQATDVARTNVQGLELVEVA